MLPEKRFVHWLIIVKEMLSLEHPLKVILGTVADQLPIKLGAAEDWVAIHKSDTREMAKSTVNQVFLSMELYPFHRFNFRKIFLV